MLPLTDGLDWVGQSCGIGKGHEPDEGEHCLARRKSWIDHVRSSRRWLRPLPVASVVGLIAASVLEADGILEFIGDVGELAYRLLPEIGPGASFLAIYLEESGIPLPLPGDVFVLYLGPVATSAPLLVAAWLGLVAAVVAGSSNLYLVSRH